jgi:NAD(P)-dependent dehydrogenase (short-subunit alcohol dehydrogenase family)
MMSSVAGLVTVPAQGAYSASKHALEGLTNALRLEMVPFGIDVILIEPGYIATGMQQAAAELTSAYKEKFRTGPYATLYAMETPRPKARYGVTPLATMVKWGKRLLSDGAIDALIRRRLGIKRDRH